MDKKKFGCYLFGSRARGIQSPKSDVDLLLVCDGSARTNIEFNLRIQLSINFPEWKGLKLDIKHAPIGKIFPEHPVALLIMAELRAKNSIPILGDHLLPQTIDIPRDLLLRAQYSILRYWANIFLTVPKEQVFSVIKSHRTLRSFYGCVQAFVTYLVLHQNPDLFFVEHENIADPQFQNFRKFFRNELMYSMECLNAEQTAELYRQIILMHSFCSNVWGNINRQKVFRTA